MTEPLIGAPTAGQAAQIQDIGADAFETEVLKASLEIPVIVDFWAPWCGPCKQLMPVLETAVRQAGDAVRMVKVNIDENPELAQALRVQSVPMVYAFYQGQPVDGFQGVQSAGQIKVFIEKLTALSGNDNAGVQIDTVLKTAAEHLQNNQTAEAEALYKNILQADPENAGAIAGYLRCLIQDQKIEDAEKLLENIPDALRNTPAITAAQTTLTLCREAGQAGDVKTLQAQHKKAPADQQISYDLALAYYADNQPEAAVDALISNIAQDRSWNGEAARVQLLKFFEALGPTHPLVISGRRKLSSALFS